LYNEVYNKSDEFWDENRFENLNKDERGVYQMLDTLQTVKKFKQIYSTVTILGSGYVPIENFDFWSCFFHFWLQTSRRNSFWVEEPTLDEMILAYLVHRLWF
jgi:hypothetical protein